MSATISANTNVQLIELAKDHVFEILKKDLPIHMYFHNAEHTELVLKSATELVKASGVEKEDGNALLLAVLFHNMGYVNGHQKYWVRSAKMAREFLLENQAPKILIEKVVKLIELMDGSSKPVSELDKLFLDACYSYYGKKSYVKRIRRLRKEEEGLRVGKKDTLAWQKDQLHKITKHIFYTPFGEELFGKRKLKNIQKLKSAHNKSLKIKTERAKITSIGANSGARNLFKTALRTLI